MKSAVVLGFSCRVERRVSEVKWWVILEGALAKKVRNGTPREETHDALRHPERADGGDDLEHGALSLLIKVFGRYFSAAASCFVPIAFASRFSRITDLPSASGGGGAGGDREGSNPRPRTQGVQVRGVMVLNEWFDSF